MASDAMIVDQHAADAVDRPTSQQPSYIADQVLDLFHERGLVPVVSTAFRGHRFDRVHGALTRRPEISLRARSSPRRPYTASDPLAPPCRACAKAHTQWLLTAEFPTAYLRRVSEEAPQA